MDAGETGNPNLISVHCALCSEDRWPAQDRGEIRWFLMVFTYFVL